MHINATNVRDVIEPLGGATVRETIENNLRSIEEQAKQAGREILAHLNHPNFGWAVTAEDIAHAVTDRYFEVYNGHPGVNQTGDEHRPGIDRCARHRHCIRASAGAVPPDALGVCTSPTRWPAA